MLKKILLLFLISLNAIAQEESYKSNELIPLILAQYKKWITLETIPANVKQILDQHASELQKIYKVSEFDWLPGWMVKPSDPYIDRIQGAKLFISTIKAHGYEQFNYSKKILVL